MERVVLNKLESIERCLARIKEIHDQDDQRLEDFLYQDALILNILRACQQAIDLAMYFVSQKGLGIPKSSKEAFILLEKNKIISTAVSRKMQGMTGFRNIAIHDYQKIDLKVIKYIIHQGVGDFLEYHQEIINYLKEQNY